MSNDAYKIVEYLQKHNRTNAKVVADALDMQKRRVDSLFSATVIKEGLGIRDTSVNPSVLELNSKGLIYHQ